MRLVKIERLKILIRTERPFFLYSIYLGKGYAGIKVRNEETSVEFEKALKKVGVWKYSRCFGENEDIAFPKEQNKIYPKDINGLEELFERRYYCVRFRLKYVENLEKVKDDLRKIGWREIRFIEKRIVI